MSIAKKVVLGSLIVMGTGLLLLAVEIIGGKKDPGWIQVGTYATSAGLAGLFIAWMLKLREKEEKKKGK